MDNYSSTKTKDKDVEDTLDAQARLSEILSELLGRSNGASIVEELCMLLEELMEKALKIKKDQEDKILRDKKPANSHTKNKPLFGGLCW